MMSIVGIIFLILFLLSTTPDRIGPTGITAFFIILLLTLVSIGLTMRLTLLHNPNSSSLLLVIVTSLAITGALALNTIEIGMGEIILLVLFIITFTIYWTKLR